MIDSKKYFFSTIVLCILFLAFFTLLTYIVDPYFHYHKPYSWQSYTLDEKYQRYINNGIIKHFDYDAFIIGTSMTENTKTSEINNLFNVNSIKVPLSGASYKEINDNIIVALKNNKNVKKVFRSLDLVKIFDTANYMRYNADHYPTYLYDDNILNDINYIFNKTILFNNTLPNIKKTYIGKESTTFDEYSNWMDNYKFGKESVLSGYSRPKRKKISNITDLDYQNINENIGQNVINITKEYPNIDFYFFYTPYSIIFWDEKNQTGELEKYLIALEYISSMLIEQENIHLYSFLDEYEIICNLDNYKDTMHYSEKINSQMLNWMKDNKGLLTKENYIKHFSELRNFYTKYKYDSLFD